MIKVNTISLNLNLPEGKMMKITIPKYGNEKNVFLNLLKEGYKEEDLMLMKNGVRIEEFKNMQDGDTIQVTHKVKGGSQSFMGPAICKLAVETYLKRKICRNCSRTHKPDAIICRNKKCGNGYTLRDRKHYANSYKTSYMANRY